MFDYDKAMADETSGVFTNIHTPEWFEKEKEDQEESEEEEDE